ncbi:MAG TPA: hypothetical protein VEA37_11930 [Flavobacterium sp.]|nr:hypothetical protein [Flavobacterium sp.]
MKQDIPTSIFSFSEFIRALIEFFFPSKRKLYGKLFVSGCGSLEFKFKHCPDYVFVDFVDDKNEFPCDPGGCEDIVDWQIVCCDSCCQLIIHWKVEGMRKIAWKVC